ncbi:hypothetical protein FB45DRAFT_1003307 [Roridomyces roridus]|uniref:F-box domain-containing protein n=1 Tax=Roridomyces roridus TaxID=1738132 RepID=A0AAD7BXQ8_9AGAR|nr:hypothetical protein FB45DRAFT_1003307 [Roridomyces roridus]
MPGPPVVMAAYGALLAMTCSEAVTTAEYPIPSHLLFSNVPPLDDEIVLFRKLLVDIAARIDVLNAQIATMSIQTAAEQIVERDALVARADQCKTVLSPTRRLPLELVCEIMTLVPCTREIGGQEVAQAPWRLGHICRSWRAWVLGDPCLWSSLHILYRDDDSDHDFPLAMVETQLMEGPSLLKISPWDLLVPLSERWKSLHIQYREDDDLDCLARVLRPIAGHLSNLERLALFSSSYDSTSIKPEWDIDIFLIAPRLREVFLTGWSGSSCGYYSVDLPIPWSQIARYRGLFAAADTHLRIFQKTPSLVECTIGVDKEDIPAFTAILPCLRRLCVDGPGGMLANIIAPSLEDLFLTDMTPTATPFVYSSSCRLKTLVLTELTRIDNLISLLEACPLLETFILSGVMLPDIPKTTPLFAALQLSGSNSDICPNLAVFAFGMRVSPDVSWKEVLFRMIRSRHFAGRLRTVRLFRNVIPFGSAFVKEMNAEIGLGLRPDRQNDGSTSRHDGGSAPGSSAILRMAHYCGSAGFPSTNRSNPWRHGLSGAVTASTRHDGRDGSDGYHPAVLRPRNMV